MTEEQGREAAEVAEDQAQDVEEIPGAQAEPPPEEAPSNEGAEVVDELTALRQELEEAKAKEAEYLDGWQRARAELSNARKRFQREQEQAYTNARADILVRLLPIVDDFERAFDTLPDNLSNPTWIEGIELIQHKFHTLLEQEGVTHIEAVNQEFDPFLHQAVTHEPSEEVPEGCIIAELQKGYKMGDRVLRPGAVRVSCGPPPEPEGEAVEEQAAADEDQA